MNTLQRKNKIVFVATGLGGGKCPRFVATGTVASFRDDYKGSLKTSKKMTRKLFLI